jgi:hypothetical protein
LAYPVKGSLPDNGTQVGSRRAVVVSRMATTSAVRRLRGLLDTIIRCRTSRPAREAVSLCGRLLAGVTPVACNGALGTSRLAEHVMDLARGANDLARSPVCFRNQFSDKGALNWTRAASE